MKRIRLLQEKVTVASGAARDFPSASDFYQLDEVEEFTVSVLPGGAVAVTVTITFADKAGTTMYTLTKALAATAALKLLTLGDVKKAGGSDFLAAGDALVEHMALPPKVRVTVSNAATTKDVSIVGRGG